MPDRTPMQLKILDCPLEQAQTVINLIEQFCLHLEFTEDGQPAADQLGLGLIYMDSEVVCGTAVELAAALQRFVAATSWELWENPKWDRLGDLFRFTPALGLWSATCNCEGDALFTSAQVLKFLDEDQGAFSRVRLETKLGIAHAEALRELAVRNDGVVLSPSADQKT